MKNILLVTLLITSLTTISYSQVGIGTTTPNAKLDVTSTDQGLLIPRVALTSLNTELPIKNPNGGVLTISTMVFHTGANGITAGFYYWDGIKWQAINKVEENKGLQYFVNTFSGTTPPKIEKSELSQTFVKSGLWSTNLDNVAKENFKLNVSGENNFIITFQGTLVVEKTGVFQFQTKADDGTKVIIDGVPVLSYWPWEIANNASFRNGTAVTLAKGKHKIEFWYYDGLSDDFMQFNWLQNANDPTLNNTVVNANSFIIE